MVRFGDYGQLVRTTGQILLCCALVLIFVSHESSANGVEKAESSTCGSELVKEAGGGAKAGVNTGSPDSKFYGYEVKSIDGRPVKLADYRGKVVMVVNTASRCGFTSQYKDLQGLYAKYKDRGFVVLGFPSNDFLRQEPGSNKEIKEFCETNFNIKFPLFEKGSVKGEGIQPVFRYLTTEADQKMAGSVSWNFEKFVIDKNGQLVGRFKSRISPSSPEVTKLIEESLNQKSPANSPDLPSKSKDSATCS